MEDVNTFIQRVMHDAHLRYQREQLRHDALPRDARSAPTEVRGLRRKRGKSEATSYSQTFQLHWFTGLRPNFYHAYVDTVLFMARK